MLSFYYKEAPRASTPSVVVRSDYIKDQSVSFGQILNEGFDLSGGGWERERETDRQSEKEREAA